MIGKKKIAFIYVHNFCHSQIAKALGKHFSGDKFDFYSAETETKPQIHQDAVQLITKSMGKIWNKASTARQRIKFPHLT